MYVYADNAATTKLSDVALQAMMPYFTEIYGNPSSLHSVGQEAKEHLEEARARVAKCLGCEAREIYFTSGGSEADNQAIVSAAYFGARKGKKHIISTAFEHHSVLRKLESLKEKGFNITLIKPDKNGLINPDDIANAFTPSTCGVSVMSINNEVGTIQPIEAIGKEFDPNFHNAVMQVESEEYEEGVIAQELLKGYMYRDTVVRYSMVAVTQ